jgi:hypothetical protein
VPWRSFRRHRPGEGDEPRIPEHPGNESRIRLARRDQWIDLLILDETIASGADALNDKIEQGGIAFDLFVVDRNPEQIVSARIAGLEPEDAVGGWHVQLRAAGAIGNPDDDRTFAAMQEKVLYRLRQRTVSEIAAEVAHVFGKARYRDRFIDRPALGAADKTGRRQNAQGDGICAAPQD